MFNNGEIRRFAAVLLVLGVCGAAAGFAISPAAGALAVVLCTVFRGVFFVFTRKRYKRIAQLSHQIDLVLHGAQQLDFDEAREGELSILHSEITKMTLCIREQNAMLMRDKEYLANSLADIAHQLGTPLTSANLILTFLAKNPNDEERQAFIRELESLLRQMDWLITSLLKISRIDAGVVTFQNVPVSLRGVLEAALKPLAIQGELQNIAVHFNVPEGAFVQGDGAWLSQAFQNIFKNCMESAGENGQLNIQCTCNALYTEITVRDNGAGFSEEDIPHLFDRFYRGKSPSASGYGIGLALCKMIISRQGGAITARNHPQGGAVFAVRFPKMTNLLS